MDNAKIAELLRATIDPNQRLQAEEQLNQVTRQRRNFSLPLLSFGGRTKPCALPRVNFLAERRPSPVRGGGFGLFRRNRSRFWRSGFLGGTSQVGQGEDTLGLDNPVTIFGHFSSFFIRTFAAFPRGIGGRGGIGAVGHCVTSTTTMYVYACVAVLMWLVA